MHHTEHQLSNLGFFSVVDAVVATFGEDCSIDVVGSGSASNNTYVELRGSCSMVAMLIVVGSITVQMQHLRSSWWKGCQTSIVQKEMLQNRVML